MSIDRLSSETTHSNNGDQMMSTIIASAIVSKLVSATLRLAAGILAVCVALIGWHLNWDYSQIGTLPVVSNIVSAVSATPSPDVVAVRENLVSYKNDLLKKKEAQLREQAEGDAREADLKARRDKLARDIVEAEKTWIQSTDDLTDETHIDETENETSSTLMEYQVIASKMDEMIVSSEQKFQIGNIAFDRKQIEHERTFLRRKMELPIEEDIVEDNSTVTLPLISAIQNEVIVSQKIELVEMPTQNEEFTSAIEIAVTEDNISVPIPLQHEQPKEDSFTYGGTIFDAVKSSNLNAVYYLVERNPKIVHTRTLMGHTPLHLAARYNNNTAIVKYLLKHGAKIEARDNTYDTPLIEAAWKNPNHEMLKYLVSQGASIFATDCHGLTLLHCAAWSNPNPDVIRYLIELGLPINVRDDDGRTSLWWSNKNPNNEIKCYLISQETRPRHGCLIRRY